MKKYTIQVVIEEGNDEFWEDLEARNVTGCDEIMEAMREMLNSYGYVDATIKMHGFTDAD